MYHGFEVTFQFQISHDGADGFAFVLQDDSLSALGDVGGSLGYGGTTDEYRANSGIPKSLAIEFDTWQNIPGDFPSPLGDPNDNHISIQTQGSEPNSADPIASLGSTTDIPFLSDGSVHTAKVVYRRDMLAVFLDDLPDPVLRVPVNLATLVPSDDGTAWVGFTAATGGVSEDHDILLFSFDMHAQQRLFVPLIHH